MDENYWKDAYQDTWDEASKREKGLKAYIEKSVGVRCSETGLGTGTTVYISGTAEKNGYQKGDADFQVEGTNVYVEVTGPLVKTVRASDPLWFRPDKLDNAIKNRDHDVFLAHHCMSADLWRVIHIDQKFKQRFRAYEFKVVTPIIKGRQERYVEIEATDRCIKSLNFLIEYLREIMRSQTIG